ncbi:MAG: site-specific integrase, partial [Bacteroidales bacterium]
MGNYRISIILETRSLTKDKKYPVKLRLTIDRQARYYGLNYYLTEQEFEKVYSPRPRDEYKKLRRKFDDLEKKAEGILEKTDPTFEKFRPLFTQKEGEGNVEKYYLTYIAELKKQNRFGTADSYQCSLRSLQEHKGLNKFKTITPEWLRDYQSKMQDAGKSKSTVGVYLRPLRKLYRRAIRDGVISEIYYPFGDDDDDKYSIPTSKNNKRPLSREEIIKLAGYSGNELYERYRDFFILSYYLMGMNFYDLLLLERAKLIGNTITFVRHKISRTEETKITANLNNHAQDIISQHGTGKGKYIFDVIRDSDRPEDIHRKVKRFVRNTNQALKKIAKEIEINPDISTIYARHSAASHGLKSGASLPTISKQLGHKNLKTTSSYLDSFVDDDQALANA